MSKRKFNLGDIIRKLNEEQKEPTQGSSHSVPEKENKEKPAFTTSIENTASESLSFGNRSQIKPVPVGADQQLPEQPIIGSNPYPTIPEFKSPPIVKEAIRQREIPEPVIEHQIVKKADPSVPTVPVSNQQNNEEEQDFDLYRYIGVILRRKNVVLAVMVLVFLYSLITFLSAPKFYIANARMLFRPDDQIVLGNGPQFQMYRDREKLLNTHLELLHSKGVLSQVAENLSGKISVGQIDEGLSIVQGQTNGQKNDIIELSLKNSNAEMARDALNELCRTYTDYRRDVNAQEQTRFIFKLEDQITKLQADLDKKESDLRQFKEQNRMVQLSDETNLTVQKLSDMELQLQKTQLDMVESRERFASLNTQISKQDLEIVQSITYHDPFKQRLADLELELNTLSAEYSPEHYKVKNIKEQIEKIKEGAASSITREAASRTLVKNPIRQELLQSLVNLTIEESSLEQKRIAQEKIIELLNQDLLKLPSIQQKYAYLQRETESLLQTLRMLKSKYEEAKIQRDSQESELKILELAQTPRIALTKVKFRNIFIGIFVGLILGIAFAFLLEYLDQSIKDPSIVERELELPLLGIVPLIETEKALVETATNLTKNILEPFRALRANLKHILNANNIKTMMMCSAVKGEGKTTLAANLAITFAIDGKKVILIDADLRRSQMHHLFNIPKEIGLADYLLASKEVDEIIKPTKYENLYVITSGERPHNPAELLGTIRLDMLLQELRTKADLVIFDSPALLPVSDTITMAPKMDACFVVVRNLWTPLKAAKQAKNQLARINTRLFGGILNGVSHSRGYYPYYYGYYGYYSYKYSYEEDRKQPFSMREFGLNLEKNFRESVKSTYQSMPRYIAGASKEVNRLVRHKSFWLMLITFITLAGVNIYLNSLPKKTGSEYIEYIGMNNSSGLKSDLVKSNEGVPLEGSRELPAQTTTVLDTTKAVANTSPSFVGFRDSLTLWVDAINSSNLSRYLTFYDTLRFRYDGGGFSNWKADVQRTLIRVGAQTKITLDSVWQKQHSIDSCESHAIVKKTDLPLKRAEHVQIWLKGSGGWKIVQERILAAP